MRYRKIKVTDIDEVQAGTDVRVHQRHQSGTDYVVTGKVTHVRHTERKKFAILEVERNRETYLVISELDLEGGLPINLTGSNGWDLYELEVGAPPLPTIPGSVVLVRDRAAALRNVAYSDAPENLQWIWADDVNGEQGPTDQELEIAAIIHTARRP